MDQAGHNFLTNGRFRRNLAVIFLVALGGFLIPGAPAILAQEVSQTLQLPTQSVFGVNTVVSVPDRGAIRMGGVRRFATGQVSRGIPGLPASPLTANRAFGTDAGASDVSVSVQIISMEELEAGLLAGFSAGQPFESRSVRTLPPEEIRRRAAFISRNLGRRAEDASLLR